MELSAEQIAMLERLLTRHQLWRDDEHKRALAALRELLLAVQERDAQAIYELTGDEDDMRYIRFQTYADLFPEEAK